MGSYQPVSTITRTMIKIKDINVNNHDVYSDNDSKNNNNNNNGSDNNSKNHNKIRISLKRLQHKY